MNDHLLHEPDEKPRTFEPGKLYSMLDIMGGGRCVCDFCGRWQSFAAVSRHQAREMLAQDGWTQDGEKDKCPRCSQEAA
jgi:hypothetical protein